MFFAVPVSENVFVTEGMLLVTRICLSVRYHRTHVVLFWNLAIRGSSEGGWSVGRSVGRSVGGRSVGGSEGPSVGPSVLWGTTDIIGFLAQLLSEKRACVVPSLSATLFWPQSDSLGILGECRQMWANHGSTSAKIG